MPASYTGPERRRIARLSARTIRQAVASDGPNGTTDIVDPAIGAELDHIRRRGEERYEREAQAAFGLLDRAENAVAQAKANLRAADSKSKPAARKALADAKAAQRKADRAARKY
ncbi:hypothetical protein [Streptomyces formicae]